MEIDQWKNSDSLSTMYSTTYGSSWEVCGTPFYCRENDVGQVFWSTDKDDGKTHKSHHCRTDVLEALGSSRGCTSKIKRKAACNRPEPCMTKKDEDDDLYCVSSSEKAGRLSGTHMIEADFECTDEEPV